MVSVEAFLGFVGLVIVIGFVGSFLFEKLRIPDILLLLGTGVLLSHWLSAGAQALVRTFAPYLGAIAIVMVLFEGGLALDLTNVKGQFKDAFLLAVATFVVTMAGVTWAMMGWLGWAPVPSMMFGAIIGCTSGAIVVPIAQRSRAPEDLKALVTMESIFSDTLAIVALVALVNLELGLEIAASTPVRHLLHAIAVALGVALPIGILWLNILEWTKERPLSYLWTFALLVLVYTAVNALDASGALAVFFLAVLVGNSAHLPRWLVLGKPEHAGEHVAAVAHDTVVWFHGELTFLVRSFFFVYIGLLFQPSYVQGATLWAMSGLTVLIALARCLGVWLLQRGPGPLSRPLVWAFLPRGLVSAVLAMLPASRGIAGSEQFLEYTVPVILSTNVLMTLWVLAWEHKHGKATVAAAEAAKASAGAGPAPAGPARPARRSGEIRS